MSKTIAVVSSTRAEYGLLKRTIVSLMADDFFEVRVVVTGAHLMSEQGNTVREVEDDGIPIHQKIYIPFGGDSAKDKSIFIAQTIQQFAEYFAKDRPDAVMVLGDRYEILAVCIAAMNARIPIFHLCGGETTQGAIDECIRHSITKMSFLHFVESEEYRKRVIQLGEDPERVYNVGLIGAENIMNIAFLSQEQLSKELDMDLSSKYCVVTFHPATLSDESIEEQVQQLLEALDAYDSWKFVITKSNIDAGGALINSLFDEYAREHSNCKLFDSLGSQKYLSALKHCEMVIGNSSSGILEAPVLGVPTINIGNRQKGRMNKRSIINCSPLSKDIIASMEKAEDSDFRKQVKTDSEGYMNESPSKTITKFCKEQLIGGISIDKAFYDL